MGERRIIKTVMTVKIGDQRKELMILKEEKAELRSELVNRFGRKTMKLKRVMISLNKVGKVFGRDQETKTGSKLKHLMRKHNEARKERDSDLGAYKEKWKDRYMGVSIYKETEDPRAFEKLHDEIDREHQEDQVPCIGELTLGSPEKALLKLPPGTSVNPKLSTKEFNHENEIFNVKLRYEQRGWEEQDTLYKEGLEACG